MKILLFCISAISVGLQSGNASETNVILLPRDAQLKGAVTCDSISNTLCDWKGERSSATWRLNLEEGLYKIVILYSVPLKSSGGTFEVTTTSKAVQFANLAATQSWTTFEEKDFGTISISRADKNLALRLLKKPNGQWLMNLKSVRLTKTQ